MDPWRGDTVEPADTVAFARSLSELAHDLDAIVPSLEDGDAVGRQSGPQSPGTRPAL